MVSTPLHLRGTRAAGGCGRAGHLSPHIGHIPRLSVTHRAEPCTLLELHAPVGQALPVRRPCTAQTWDNFEELRIMPGLNYFNVSSILGLANLTFAEVQSTVCLCSIAP